MQRQSTLRTRIVRGLGAATATVALASGLTACGGDANATDTAAATGKVTIGAVSNGAARQAELPAPAVESLRAQLPKAVRERGELVIGIGALPAGYPPSPTSAPTRRRSRARSPTSADWSRRPWGSSPW